MLGAPVMVDPVATREAGAIMEEIHQEVPPPQVSPPRHLCTIRVIPGGYVGEQEEDPQV